MLLFNTKFSLFTLYSLFLPRAWLKENTECLLEIDFLDKYFSHQSRTEQTYLYLVTVFFTGHYN